jgi:hypothetical protein
MASCHIKDIQWSDRTGLEDGMLYVDQEALRRLVMEEGDFAGVDLEIVRPGENVRLIHMIDVVEQSVDRALGPGRWPDVHARQRLRPRAYPCWIWPGRASGWGPELVAQVRYHHDCPALIIRYQKSPRWPCANQEVRARLLQRLRASIGSEC